MGSITEHTTSNSSLCLPRVHISRINSLWPADAIQQHGSLSTLAQVGACYLPAPDWTHVDISSMWVVVFTWGQFHRVCSRYQSIKQIRAREGYFGLQINTKITLEWAQKQFVMRVHTLFYSLHNIMTINMTIKTTIFTHWPRASLAGFTFCWWHHNRLLMTSQ